MIHIRTMRLAVSIHHELGTDLTKAVDVYGSISRLGITLDFEPLKGLSGAYLPRSDETGGLPGILINSRHPVTRQRFSAGHELGHHLADGELVFDAQTEFLARAEHATNEREATAEAFAAWFLMPRQLVDHMASRVGIKGEPSAEQVYRLSLELGTSYLATTYHLVDLKILRRERVQALAAISPKWIKRQIAVHGPGDSWGDVWRVRRDGDQTTINPRPGDEIVIELEEVPSSGYSWQLQNQPSSVSVIQSSFEPLSSNGRGTEEAFGAVGTRLLVLRAEEPGTSQLRLVMRHPWEPEEKPVDTFTVDLAIVRKHEGIIPFAATA